MKPSEQQPLETAAPVAVDFETHYATDYSVKELGNRAYCNDPRFNAWAVSVHDGETTWAGRPKDCDWQRIHGRAWVSHHREFDKAVFARLQRDGVIPKIIAPSAWHCSAAACAFLQLPRDLKGACSAVLGEEPDKSFRKALKGRHDNDLFDALDAEETAYATQDAVLCWRLWQSVGHRWPERERRLFDLTCEMGERGLAVDWTRLEQERQRLSDLCNSLQRDIPWQPSLSIKEFKRHCGFARIAPPSSTAADDASFRKWCRKHEGTALARYARNMNRIRTVNRLVKVLEAMQQRRKPDGRMAYELKYYGATPGRWAGSGGLNVQNMNRSEIEGLDLRKLIIAPEGKTLAVADFSQIEARVLLWLAGDSATLEMLRLNPDMDMYEVHARATMGYQEQEPLKVFCERTKENLRQLAKARVLGLGFRCGAERFIEVARILAGLEIDIHDARKIVREYRESNPKIVKLWETLESTCSAHEGRDYYLPFPCASLGDSPRHLIYRDVGVDDRGGLTAVVCGERVDLHGGILAENWTQGTARDLLADAWIRCVDAGYAPVLSVHDELVFEVDAQDAQEHLKQIKGLMEAAPKWAQGLPVKADVKLMTRYGK
jgi:DNA polymerase